MACRSVILAAGHGTRMNSEIPKVLHQLGGRPLVRWVVDACLEATGTPPHVVVGPNAEEIRDVLGEQVTFVEQPERLGTGHAVLQTEGSLRDQSELIVVTHADLPLLVADTLVALIERQAENDGPCTMLTVISDDPRGFGRVIRDSHGAVVGIVEEAEATPEQLQVRELNVGAYCFRSAWLWESLPKLEQSSIGEYYLTDLIEIAVSQAAEIATVQTTLADEEIGINTREHLAQAEAALRRRVNLRLMLSGVTMLDPAMTYIDPEVQIGADTVILPNTHLQGNTRIGSDCRVGPNTIVRDSSVGDRCRLEASVVEEAVLEDEVSVGPFAHLRRGAHLKHGVHMGNFGEIKNSTLEAGVKVGHFSYIGDALIGEGVNIGAGTITCNFDGERKHRTEVGEGAFIGSDTMLVAPVKIGKGARTGAGSVVTHDVPDHSVAVGAPARVVRRLRGKDE